MYSICLSRSSLEAAETRLPLLRYVIRHGNVTCFEYQTGVKPTRVENTSFELDVNDDINEDQQKDNKEDEAL
jgi:CDK5 regulatory subunit-associated protein 3